MFRRYFLFACLALMVTLTSSSKAQAWWAAGARGYGYGGYRAGGVAVGGYRAGGVAYGGCHYGAYGGYRAGYVRRW